jgi:hypothetical protein
MGRLEALALVLIGGAAVAVIGQSSSEIADFFVRLVPSWACCRF